MIIQSWTEVLVGSLQNVWQILMGFLPSLLGAIIVFLVGLLVSAGLEKLVERIIYYSKLDNLLRRLGVETYLQRANLQLNSGRFIGKIVYWFFLIVFFLAASDILGFTAISEFLNNVLSYIPNILIAVLIMLVALILANFLRGAVKASALSARLHSAKFLGTATWWVIMIFGVLAACVQLKIAVSLINTIVTGVIAMLALAGGLAFGLGGKDLASKILADTEERVERKD